MTAMDLKGCNVLVDGYNLAYPQGTGIKTYGLTLIDALTRLGATVDVLYGTRTSRDPRLNEILFFDVVRPAGRDIVSVLQGIREVLTRSYRARPVEPGAVIRRGLPDDLTGRVGVFNATACYRVAQFVRQFGMTITVPVPKRVDVWHLTYPLPINVKRARRITTIHDLVPLRLPYTTNDNKRWFYQSVRDAIRDSALIVTVSEHSKADLLQLFDVPPEKVAVTYEAVPAWPRPTDDAVAATLRTHRLARGRYLLFVGAVEPKKNLERLVEAFSLVDTDLTLVVVGKRGWLWKNAVRRMRSTPRVRWLEYVSRKDLACLYAGARCFVFPSLYEGFGLPPLEAMWFGCPVVTSNVASLPEVCGEGALYVDPYDVGDIQAKIEEVLGDDRLREKLAEAGRSRVEAFSLDRYVPRLYDAYRRVL